MANPTIVKYIALKEIRSRKKKKIAIEKIKIKKRINIIRNIFLSVIFVLLLIALVFLVYIASLISEVSKDIIKIDPSSPFENVAKYGDSIIYSSDGIELRRLSGFESKEFIKIDEIPNHVKAAFIAAEDKTFYDNKGINIGSLFRAFLTTLFSKNVYQGGSTITQQVVKVNLIGDKKDLKRKIKEIILSAQIAQRYSKDEILQLYLNTISFGSNFVGIKRASNAYFNKDPKDLTYGEAALLAGIPNEPARLAPEPYNSDKNTDDILPDGTVIKANIRRQRDILSRMDEIYENLNEFHNFKLDQVKIKSALIEPIIYNMPKTADKAPHFVKNGGVVYEELKSIFKEKENPDLYISTGGLRVYTTLDYDMQQKAEKYVSLIDDDNENVASICPYCGNNSRWGTFGAKNASMISVNTKTGAVMAYVGSKDFNADDGAFINGQVDVLQRPVSQGSSMKPFTYLNAFINRGFSPSTVWANFPIDMGGGYIPRNFSIGDKPAVSVSSEWALNNSLNIPAVQTLMAGGVDNYKILMKSLGYKEPELEEIDKAGITATLGAAVVPPYSHAQAYQTLANGGVKKDFYTIQRITDREGNIIYEKQDNPGIRVIDEQHDWLVLQILQKYTTVQQIRREGYDAAGKTGTNDFGINGLPTSIVFWGFTPDLVTGVWAGNSNNQPLKTYAVGEKLGQVLWTPYMREVLPKFKNNNFNMPSGIVSRIVCSDTGFLATSNSSCPRSSALFVDGEFPKVDNNHNTIMVVDCNGSIKLASAKDIQDKKAYPIYSVRYETNTGNPWIQSQIDNFAGKSIPNFSPGYCTP
ncbi:MAG: transglycosylase domain-containing protein [bacterium]